MSASDELAAIEARLIEDENEYAGGVVDKNVRDRRYLLALVLKLQARLARVEAVASDFAERGVRIEEQFGREGDGSNHTIRAAGLGDGYRDAARSISAALDPAMSEPDSDAMATEITRRQPEHQPQRGAPGLPPEALAG
ncbi:hypothetical protein QFZ79_002983 [Arthrobacter sp. V4I6]|uniref:hypothetical protein n=1 Tax=unclassified Arthrobacter TaxID=235627 RepID=UPI00278A5D20|nr:MULTISPECIES: hypothetical protein [unclassified Arthrobacter]MDQ0820614.1 hypothetical protein [Arthrobacter sp. V1I7]MDQ0854872.1 hypothetical protein [Arthrobacter sp. V4I6]